MCFESKSKFFMGGKCKSGLANDFPNEYRLQLFIHT